ncbi:MAG: DUF4197 domain-containing protein [Bacteroidota bacterium]|nr:DUF4197 domain-containing protein [Bacteroidota bacterium]MDP4259510.1 DUF4197 domain-containing protein [Bacteroidota bacterium]
MKKLSSLFVLSFLSFSLLQAQGLPGGAKSLLGSGLSSDDIVGGLKQALSQGAQKSTDKLSAADGFFKDAAVKILFPPEAEKVERTLRSAGFGAKVDETILDINRAAESAAKSAAPIFLNAIRNMSVQDGLGILRGTDTSATAYLRKSTVAQLIAAFRPVIEDALQKAGATQAWKSVFDVYNKNPFAKKVNTDLPGYVTLKALDGIFFYVAREEKNIRQNPAAQATDLLKKVFGGK